MIKKRRCKAVIKFFLRDTKCFLIHCILLDTFTRDFKTLVIFCSFSISVQGVSLPTPIEPSVLIVLSGNPGTNQIRIPAPFPPKREEEQL